MEKFFVVLDNVPRPFLSPSPPVLCVGYARNNFFWPRVYTPKAIGVGVTLGSENRALSVSVRGETFSCAPPAVHVEFPTESYLSGLPARRELFYFTYDGIYAPFFRSLGLTPDNAAPWSFDLTPRIVDVIESIKALALDARAYGTAGRVDRYCDLLLYELLLQRTRPAGAIAVEEEKILSIASYLEVHFAERHDIQDLARRHGLSFRSFYRHWKRMFGVTPITFVEQARLKHAQRLLAVTDLKIYEVASEVGFVDPLYFSKRFRQETGMAPGAFRRAR